MAHTDYKDDEDPKDQNNCKILVKIHLRKKGNVEISIIRCICHRCGLPERPHLLSK